MYMHTHTDINECGGDHGCEQACNNTAGSFHCACFPGYILNEDGVTCRGTKLNRNIQSYNLLNYSLAPR